MMLQIDTKDLTQDELDLLQALVGSQVEKKAKEKIKSKPCKQELEPYTLRVETYCATCEMTHVQYFKMEFSEDKTHLHGVPLEAEDWYNTAKYKEEYRIIRYCNSCPSVLKSFTLEKLVDKLLKEVRRHYE